MSSLLLLLAASTPASACDAAALSARVFEASPVAIPGPYAELAACDPGAAQAAAPVVFGKLLAGDDANPAVAAGLTVGAADEVSGWLKGLQPDERSRTVGWLGGQCKTTPEVEAFFVKAHTEMGAAFFEERWYRGLADCRTPSIQALLTSAIEGDEYGIGSKDRGAFLGLLEVYSRNLGAQAVPRLEAFATQMSSGTEAGLIVSAFGDAANLGSTQGVNQAAAKDAIAALVRLGPQLPPTATDQARETLRSLGDEAAANDLVQYKWPDRLTSGTYTYRASASEIVTCKNGKVEAYFHHGDLLEGARLWPDAVKAASDAALRDVWKLEARAAKCKGTAEIETDVTSEPVGDASEATQWLDLRRKAFKSASSGAGKVEEIAEEPARL